MSILFHGGVLGVLGVPWEPIGPSGSDAVRAISKTLAARGIPLTSNQIQHRG